MDEILKKQTYDNDGFFSPELKHYDHDLFAADLPSFSIERETGRISIEIDLGSMNPSSTVGSTLTSSVSIKDKDLLNLVHDVSFGHLCDSTDIKFHKKFGIKGDGYDNLSPDMIVELPSGRMVVVEFTTFRGGEKGCYSAARDKVSKYSLACENRSSRCPVSLFVIAVHKDGVWTNLDLSDQDVNEIVFRFRMSISIHEEVRKLCPEITDDDSELSKTERELIGTLSMISMNWEETEKRFPHFSKKLFDHFRSEPINEEYISSIISKSLSDAQNGILKDSYFQEGLNIEERKFLNVSECDLAVKKYVEEYDRHESIRDIFDSKSTVQFPPWVFMEGNAGKSLESLKSLNIDGEHPMIKIWHKVVQSATIEEIERMYDDPQAELEFALSGSITRAEQKNKYHRVRINLSSEESEFISCLGVGGKKNKDTQASKDARKRSKLAFSLRHDISQLEEFICKDSRILFTYDDSLWCPLAEDYELRLSAQSIHQPTLTSKHGPNEFLKNHVNLLKTPFMSWCQLVSITGAELSASVKQHVKQNQFVIKRLLNSPVYLLIRPTSSKSHIFVSFAIEKSFHIMDLDRSSVFKTYYDAGDMFVTDFVSFKLSKLTNLCKCQPLMESAVSYWIESFNFNPWDSSKLLSTDRSSSIRESTLMIKLSLLTLMEDKAVTEELQTLQRYVVMEGFVSQPEMPKPHKMLNKIPGVLRSELQVYLFWRLVHSMKRISQKPFLISKKQGQISWSNLFNPLSGNDIRSLQALISSCYNGYFKNKEEETEPSSLSKMYKKIIELEHLCPENMDYLGFEDPLEPKMHEFSRSYLKQCIDHAKQCLRKMYGHNVMDQIDNQITRDVASITLERLATLKASSNFNESWYNYKDVKDKQYSRDKVIVKMSEMASSGKTLAIQCFEECMSKIESRGCMHICLFKKQQHGGLREIYVMGAEERIVQSIIESIAKSIGRFFPSDTLCNPGNKTKIPESHGMRARSHCKGSVWTCATSDDARKWNQGHFVTKFALMLCEFTQPKWWPIIIRGCSMFTNKYMMMNLQYLSILDKHREILVEDDFVNDLFLAYHGEKPQQWIDTGSTYLKTKTGMMQGILHFTSSLLHTIHQEFIRSLSFKIFNLKVHPEMAFNVVCDMMQGSDDSSMIISFPAKDDIFFSKCKMAAALCFRIKKLLGVYLAIYPSEKSTSNTDFVMEYNSEFYFHSQHIRPTIRWIAASCSLPEVETLVARQEEATNLMTSVTEGGGSFSLAHCIQHSQCSLHYMLMGMGLSSLFGEFKKAILKWKDPGLGFFLLDNPYCAGLGGFRFNLFKAITQTNLKQLYAYFMKKVRKGDEDSDFISHCSVSPGGAIILSSALKWGSKQKFIKLRSRLDIPDDWIERINDNPSILYRAPRTGEEIKLRIAEKVHSPGVVSSLSTGNAVAKVMASSVYFLSASIFQDSGRQEFSVIEDSKYSLLQKMLKFESFSNVQRLQDDEMLFLFPNMDELLSLDQLVFDRGQIDIAYRVSHRENTQTKITVFEGHHNLRIAAENLVSDKWFGTLKSKIGSTAFDIEWNRLKSIISWLRDDSQESLESSPLTNHIQIRNFFARMENKPRTVRVTGAPVRKRSGSSKLSMVIRDNFCKTGHIREFSDVKAMNRSFMVELLKHFCFCVLQGPYTNETKETLIIRVMQESEVIGTKESDGKSRTNILSIIQNFLNSDSNIIRQVEELGAGTIGGFILPQKSKEIEGKVHYFGKGIWRGVMDGSQVQVELFNKVGLPPQVTSITTDEKIGIWDLAKSVKIWCEDIGAKNDIDMSKDTINKPKYWLHGFRAYTSDKPYGCPVHVSKARMTDFRLRSEEEIFFKVRKSTMNLYVKNSGRDVHIVSYTAHDNDLSTNCLRQNNDYLRVMREIFCKEPSSSWAFCQSLPHAFIHKILDLCEGKISRPTIDNERLANLVRICTENSLRVKVGTIYSALPSYSDAYNNVDVDSLVDLMIEDMTKSNFEEAVQMMREESNTEYDIEEFDVSDIDLFGPAHYKETSDLTMISHPLMDDFMNHLIAKCSRKEIRRCLELHRCQQRFLSLFKDLYRALRRDPEDLKVDDLLSDSNTDIEDDMIG
ncbi:polymerase [Sandfly fever Naples virus]|uniref:RNA-directed RNA polymerase L n=2 Tax=Phlebovirus TaxID=11584 RepID=A0ABM5MCQ1_9VIRU|nr:polymerase [Leticia virus]AEL29649.1 polymerase [Leticia virus]AEL29661.1 polymerase [Sandfly fever Naples virus]